MLGIHFDEKKQVLQVLLSPNRRERRAWLLEGYRASLREQTILGPGCLWIAPSFTAAGLVRESLIRTADDAFLAPAVVTFARLAEIVLGEVTPGEETPGEENSRVRPLGKLQQGRLLRQAIAKVVGRGELQYFGAIAETGGFESLLGELIRELKKREVSPQQFRHAQRNWFQQSKRRTEELAQLYQEYENLLQTGNLADAESRLASACSALGNRQSPSFDSLAMVVVEGFSEFSTLEHKILAILSRRAREMVVSLPGDPLPSEEGVESDPRTHLFADVERTLAELRSRHAKIEFRRPSSHAEQVGRNKLRAVPARECQETPELRGACSGLLTTEKVAANWPAQEYLRRNLFRSYRHLEPAGDGVSTSLDRMEIVAASSVENEMEEIARRIKLLLVRGEAKPADIVVAFRSVREASDQLRTVFHDYGIPHAIDAPKKVAATALARGLLDVLRLHLEDWPFRRLLAVVTNRSLACFDCIDANQRASGLAGIYLRATVELCIREAQLPSGSRPLLDLLARWAGSASEEPEPDADSRAARAGRALAVLRPLREMLATKPASGSMGDSILHLETLMRGLGLLPASKDADQNSSHAAWQILCGGLRSIAQVDGWTSTEAPTYSTAELAQLLTHLAAEERLPTGHDDVGRVRILSAPAARELTPRYLFLAGLSEKAFPATDRPDRLYQRHQYQSFTQTVDGSDSDAVELADDAHSGEMLLFYELVTAPTCRLTLSYPALDAKAQDLPPSPFLTELERCFGEQRIPRTKIPLGQASPTGDTVCGTSQWRQVAVLNALDRKREYLAGLCSNHRFGSGAAILDAIESIGRRADRQRFGPFDGLLESEAVGEQLAKRFGSDHLWSPSQLERYGSCPFRFFAEQVLSIEPLADIALESDARRLGNLVHQTLATLHHELRDVESALAQADQLDPKLVESFQQALDQVVAATPLGGLDQVLRKIDCREVEAWADQYGRQYADYCKSCESMETPMQPRFFEVRFGPGSRKSTSESDADLSTDEPFVLPLDVLPVDGGDSGDELIRITGQIDRIDVGKVAGQTVFNVIDYKSGKAVKLKMAEVSAGRQLQLPLYAMAAEQMLLADFEAVAWQAGYWNIRQGGYEIKTRGSSVMAMRERVAEKIETAPIQTTEPWKTLRTEVLARVRAMVANVRAGNFPVYNEDANCTGHCPISTVCRVAHIRSLDKQWVDEAATIEES